MMPECQVGESMSYVHVEASSLQHPGNAPSKSLKWRLLFSMGKLSPTPKIFWSSPSKLQGLRHNSDHVYTDVSLAELNGIYNALLIKKSIERPNVLTLQGGDLGTSHMIEHMSNWPEILQYWACIISFDLSINHKYKCENLWVGRKWVLIDGKWN